jgi:hypothetical protein
MAKAKPQAEEAEATTESAGIDPEAAQEAALRRMHDVIDEMDLQAGTLVGDLTIGLADVVKRIQKPWDAHSQAEKRDLASALGHLARDVVKRTVDIVAQGEKITVAATVEKIAVSDKVVATLKLASMSELDMGDAIHNLYASQKKRVLIVLADHDAHMGSRREAVEPDEEQLPFEADTEGEGGGGEPDSGDNTTAFDA